MNSKPRIYLRNNASQSSQPKTIYCNGVHFIDYHIEITFNDDCFVAVAYYILVLQRIHLCAVVAAAGPCCLASILNVSSNMERSRH